MPRENEAGPLTTESFQQQSIPVALLLLLLEQFVAGPGAGQEQSEALEAETRGSEVSFALGLPRRGAPLRMGGGGPGLRPASSSVPAPRVREK